MIEEDARTMPQPYQYLRREAIEPDWRRFPGWTHVTANQWRDLDWQRTNSIKSVRRLREVLGSGVGDTFYKDLQRDQVEHSTMAMLLTPQIVNTMVPDGPPTSDDLYSDPVRRYILPVFSDRHPEWPSHPCASRDSLHEAEMWRVEGLTHRYPTKVLAELVSTCPMYCGHCTRMDLVGPATAQAEKYRFQQKPKDRRREMLDYIRATPSVRDVVVSGGDLANLPWPRLEEFVTGLLEIENVRDIRLASKGLMSLPQHWLSDEVRRGVERVARTARQRGVSLAIHTHVNSASQVTQMFTDAARAMAEAGIRHIRNQGVLLRGVNATTDSLLDLCFSLLDNAGVTPYYFYMCDMVPGSEHWRTSLPESQELQHSMMGYLPGFATPRIVCDVPYLGKRWVHQAVGYDHERGISYWTKNYLTPIEADDGALLRQYEYYDPIYQLPSSGRAWWKSMAAQADANFGLQSNDGRSYPAGSVVAAR